MTTTAPAGVVLAAGEGTRLRPLTDLRPKALCPVGGVPLVDLALDRLIPLTGSGPDRLAVNAHHHVGQVLAHFGHDPAAPRGTFSPGTPIGPVGPAGQVGDVDHVGGTGPGGIAERSRALVQVELGEALGTAGAIGALLPWLDGRPALVTNADCYLPGGSADLTAGWDGERCRLLCVPTAGRPDFTAADGTGLRYVGTCLLPWHRIRGLTATPTGLYEVLWRADVQAGALDLVQLPADAVAIDCGTPADYLAANLHASGGQSVIGAGATVLGRLERSVVWDGAWVGPHEYLVDQIRAGDRLHPLTVDLP